MHHPIFGHSFAVLVAAVLLSVLAFKFLNKKRPSVRRNVEDADAGASGSSIPLPEVNSGASSSSTAPTEIKSSAPSLSAANSSASSSSTISTKSNNGASSSLIASSRNRYDVFLSFGGLDIREGFADHLYNKLVGAGILVFRDDNELRQREEMGLDHLAVIMNSKILIPILSENYGSSKWCLVELVQMLECKNNMGHIILPIFYKVEPTHVQHLMGSFGDAFRTCERLFDKMILEKWKQALNEVGSLKGLESKRDEGQLVNSVVQKVLIELKKEFELATPENLVGLDRHVEKVMKFIDNNSSRTLFIGIHGMGGIGKTTLAKTIFNQLLNQFMYRSFIANIRESCRHRGLEYLQNQFIFDVLNQRNQVYNESEGTKFLSSKFIGKKVLILLDDVDDGYQLKALAGNHNWFSSGSRILITTRNKSILDNAGVDYNYEHEEMDENQSLILFSRHAFRRNSPPSEFESLTHAIVSTTGGLPLSLEILGSLLCGKTQKMWRIYIKKLRVLPTKAMQETLWISYNALDYGQQQIFLDIACLLIGTNRRIASYMWDDCGFFPGEGIEVLRFLSLIKVGDDDELIMHDQLRDFGRQVVRQENMIKPWYRSRLWESKEVLKVLKSKKGTGKIEAISSEGYNRIAYQGGNIHTAEQFKNLTSLRLLHVNGAHFIGDFENLFEELRWLDWRHCPLTFEANNFHPMELVVLNLSRSEISDQWRGWSFIMIAKKLKFLDLTLCRSLKGTFFLSFFKNLEVLILKDCEDIEQIDSSIGDMKSLVLLDLMGCKSLKELPTDVGKLEALEQLLLKDSPNIYELPDIRALQKLKILNISCTGIKELPNGIERLRNLQDLDASGCKQLLGEMPESFRNCPSLQRLNFHGCKELQSLPELPSSLTYLSVTCQSRRLPSLSHLSHLKELQLLDCKFLECIFELPSTILELSECSQLTDVAELPKTLNTPFKLEVLKMHGCEFMETLDVSQLNHLKSEGLKILHASSCENLVKIQGLDRLEFLEELDISWSTSINRLDLPKSKCLKILNAKHCKNLVEIQGLNSLEFLEVLNICRCASIERLNLSKSNHLKILDARDCESLVEIQGLDRLEFLEELNISWWASIERLYIPKSKGLKILNAKRCENLVEIQGLHKLEFLEEFNVSKCSSIERLDLPKSKNLKILDAQNCKNLVQLQGLNRLEFLEELNISGCSSIKRLDLPKLEHLKNIYAENCKNLVEIQGLDRLEFLEELNIFGCVSLKKLDLPQSESLKILDTKNCENSVDIQALNRLEFLEDYTSLGVLQLEGWTFRNPRI